MDHHDSRGRSPSVGHQNSSRHPSRSPFRDPNSNPTLDQQSVAFSNAQYNTQFVSNQPTFDGSTDFLTSQAYTQAPTYSQGGLFQDQSLPQGLTSGATTFNTQPGNNLYGEFGGLTDTSGLNNGFDPPLFPDTGPSGNLFDPILMGTSSTQQPSVNPTSIQMSTQAQSPTPPHLLSPAMNRQGSGSPHNSPGLTQGGFQPPQVPSPGMQHSRHTSLDPSSAAYPQQGYGQEWGNMQNWTHRRQPSDTRSEISNSSAHPSPYLGNSDSFDHPVDHHSPMLHAQQDPAMFEPVMGGIGSFTISDATQQQNVAYQQHITPAHSPAHSPRLVPQQLQQQLPSFSANNFRLMDQNQYNGQQGIPMFQQQQESFPDFQGHNEAMSPPEINIQLAPPSRQASFEPAKPEGSPEGALSPPDRSRSRNRTRAKSDSSVRGGASPSGRGEHKDMLSPAAAGVGSRSPSPSGKTGTRRSSTSSVPNRDYILDLADPKRPASGSSGEPNASKRTQKHPATFQCSLCPKRFTRAYNLRSHLRTHTDERPFVCNHCGKAFARQHDRKRHEGLHSGEKKFVCRGQLKENGQWGCGRRFARADALGRHFRSEAGRVCIKPLLEEEAAERQNSQNAQGMQPMMGQMLPGQPMLQQPQASYDAYGNAAPAYDPNMQMYRLPNALLQQYPTLGNIWDTLPANGAEEMDGDISGQNSFDGSSAGEYEDDGDYGHPNSGWASDVGPQGSYT